MEQLKMMKNNLISCVQAQMANLKGTNIKELGEAIDMIKDLEEAIYYCTITKAMEEKEEGHKDMRYFSYPPIYYNEDRRSSGRMYYDGGNTHTYPSNMDTYNYPSEIRDYREGRSPITRRNYMESKELHHGKEKQMKELEKYMNELTQDIFEMISDASPEEKVILSQKLTTLSEKIK